MVIIYYSGDTFKHHFEILKVLRILTGLKEDDIQKKLKQLNSKFKTYKSSPGVYTFKDLAVVLSRSFRT